MNEIVKTNFAKVTPMLFLFPLAILFFIISAIYFQGDISTNGYIEIQKKYFFEINRYLSQYPLAMVNLTQMGDALIILSFFTLLIVYAPKYWEALFTASLLSFIPCVLLKNLFEIPRPAAVLDHSSFLILGKVLMGHNSLPSGHSITIFTVITVSLFAFMPKGFFFKFLNITIVLFLGYTFAITRVGVGAHYPLDVLIGSVIGFITGLVAIFITRKYPIFKWLFSKRFYPLFMLILIVSCFILVVKINKEELYIYYIALFNIFVSLTKIIHVYFKKTYTANTIYNTD